MIGQEEARLKRLFRGAMVAAMAAPLACGGGSSTSVADAGPDGSVASDASQEASVDAATDVEIDVPRGPCSPYDDPDAALELCGFQRILPCGVPAEAGPRNGCYLANDDCNDLCEGVVFSCSAVSDSCVDGSIPEEAGALHLDCQTCLGGPGRRPGGLDAPRASGARTRLGRHLADAAHLERASILSFARLGRELRRMGAPASFSRLAHGCAQDELRHARTTTRLARAHGAEPARPRVAPSNARRSLEEMALENAIEGCVGETYAALVAAWQAAHAQDRSIAIAMRDIARDELRHAAFSWAIARWASGRLDADANARISSARRNAVAALRRHVTRSEDSDVAASAGLPATRAREVLIDQLESALWA